MLHPVASNYVCAAAVGALLLSLGERHEEFCSENRCFLSAGACRDVSRCSHLSCMLNPTKNNTGRQIFIQPYMEVLQTNEKQKQQQVHLR